MRKSWLLALILSIKALAQVNAYPPTASAVPSGAAGGDLAGTYPNPTIDLTLAKAWTAIHIFRANGIAATPTERIRLQNQTSATAGVPSQWSPCIYFEGQGWKTDATAASQKVEFRQCLVPVQGAAAPQARLDFGYAINGGAFASAFSLTNGGAQFYDQTPVTGTTSIQVRQGATASIPLIFYNSIGTSLSYVSSSGGFYSPLFTTTGDEITLSPVGLQVADSAIIRWSSSSVFTGGKDIGIARSSPGRLQIYNGNTVGKWGVLDIGAISMQSLVVPSAPTVTPTCVSACTQTWTYGIVAKLADGTTTEVGATGSTAAQNATLDGTNFNVLTWSVVTGATSYDVRRTVSGGTPATLGLIATVTAATFTDDGDTGDATASPTVNATGSLLFATDSRADIGASGANRPRNIYTGGFMSVAGYLVTGDAIGLPGTSYIAFSTRSLLRSPTDGDLTFSNAAETSFGRLKFGGNTASFPALKRFGNAIGIRAADDTVLAFDALTACSAAGEGAVSPVSDSSTATWGATVTGGGANRVLAYCNGTNWTVAAK